MRRVVIASDGWLASKSGRRGYAKLIRLVMSLASENGYTVSVQGQRWAEPTPKSQGRIKP